MLLCPTVFLSYIRVLEQQPHLKAATRGLFGHDSNFSSIGKSFYHAGELYGAKRANLGVQTFAILMFMRMNSDLI